MKTCQLCLKQTKLIRSHIIPKFFTRKIVKDPGCNKNTYYITSDDGVKLPRSGQGGVWEYLLCSDCEEMISSWETYASQFWFHPDQVGIKKAVSPNNYPILTGINYARFRLFQLSVLFKSAVSKRREFCSVNLPEKHISKIRYMLLSNDPGKPWEYPCNMIQVTKKGDPWRAGVWHPGRKKKRGFHFYRFLLDSWFCVYIVGSHVPPEDLLRTSVQENGTFILVQEEYNRISAIKDYAKRAFGHDGFLCHHKSI